MITRLTCGMKWVTDRGALRFVTSALLSVLVSVRADAQVNWSPVTDGFPRTAAELNDFTVTTGHAEMWEYLEKLRGAGTDLRLGTYGQTWEGRDLAYAVFSRPAVSEPWEASVLGRPIDGGARPYNLNYQCPSHADPALEITLLCDQEIFPAIDAKLATEGYTSWYYTAGDATEWRVGDSLARIGRNYGGFVNSVGILIEAPTQTLEVGARAGYLAYLAIVQFAAEHADRLMSVVADARAETIEIGAAPRGDVTVEMIYTAEEYPVSYELVRNGGRGTDPNEPVESVHVTGARLMKKPVATKTRKHPWAYLLPRLAVDAVAMLRRHGIAVERLTEPAELRVDAYTVAGVTYEKAFNHAAATVVEVGEVVTQQRLFPTGTYVVPTAQSLGRLVAHMLEVETRDNVVYWNTLDPWIPRSPVVPIFKLMTPMPLSTLELGG